RTEINCNGKECITHLRIFHRYPPHFMAHDPNTNILSSQLVQLGSAHSSISRMSIVAVFILFIYLSIIFPHAACYPVPSATEQAANVSARTANVPINSGSRHEV